jgi:cell division protein FtsW (lipid II flippase)
VAVLVPALGKQVNGSKRWLSLYVVNLQPSELMKLFVVLYAASYAVRKASFLHAEQPLRQTLLKGFLPLLAVMIAISALLLHEPDFGACVVIVAIAFGILFLGGLDWRLLTGLGFLLPIALWMMIRFAPYRLQRFTGFLDHASKSCSTFPRPTPTSCSPSWPRSSASPVWRWSSCCLHGCWCARTRSGVRRRAWSSLFPRWWLTE